MYCGSFYAWVAFWHLIHKRMPKMHRPSVVHVESEKKSLSKILFELEDSFHVSFNYDYETVRNIYLAEDFLWNGDENLEDVLSRLLSKVNLKYERLDVENYVILGESRKSNSIGHDGTSGLTDQSDNCSR